MCQHSEIQYFMRKTYFALQYLQREHLHPPTRLTHRDGLYLRKGGALLSLVMYGFCSNKAPYLASLSLTMFIRPAAVARRVLQKRVSILPSLSGCFLGIGSLVFSKFQHGYRNPNEVVHDRTRFFQKNFFYLKHWKKGSKLGPKQIFFVDLIK